jgi:hypothetical protein
LDGALLLGERVRLRFPDDVELSFRGRFRGAVIALEEVEIRWGEGVVNFGTYRGFYAFIDEREPIGPIGRAIRQGLEYEPWTFPQWTFAQYIERGRQGSSAEDGGSPPGAGEERGPPQNFAEREG